MTALLSPPSPAATRSTDAPEAHAPSTDSRRARLRAQWFVLAGALTVLAGVLVAWAITRAADRVEVVTIARPVAAGTEITAADLTTVPIAFDGMVTGLVPGGSIDSLVGRTATVDLAPGTLVSRGMWADGSGLAAGESLVGAVLAPGHHPSRLATGSLALAVALEGDDAQVTVRVIDADSTEQGDLSVTLAVPAADAVRVAQLAAAERLVLVGLQPDGADG